MNMKKTIFFDRKLRIKYKLFEKKKKIYTYISKEVGKEILPLLHKKNLTGLNFSLEDQLFSSSAFGGNNFLAVPSRLLQSSLQPRILLRSSLGQRSFTPSQITPESAKTENKIITGANVFGIKKEPKLIIPFQGAKEAFSSGKNLRVAPATLRASLLAREPPFSSLGLLSLGAKHPINRSKDINQTKNQDNIFYYMVFNNLERIFKKLEKKKLFFSTRKLPTFVKIKNRCLLSSGSRSIYSKLRLGRQTLKKEIHLGSLPSFTKASF